MLPIINYTLNELKTLFQKSWEWRLGYILIGGFIAARWLGLFSSLELITLDFFLSHRMAEKKDEHVVIVLVEGNSVEGSENTSDKRITELLELIFSADPAVVGLNIFRKKISDEEGRADLVEIFELYPNLIGVEKALPPRQIPPMAGISEEASKQQFGINDIPIDKDGRIRRVFIGAYLSDQENVESDDDSFRFSFSYKIAEKYLQKQGYDAGNSLFDPKTLVFRDTKTDKETKIPRLKKNFGGYVRDRDIADVQTLLNFRSGNETFTILNAADLLNHPESREQLSGKAVIIGPTDYFFPRFLPVSASSNFADEEGDNANILRRIGIIGAELEAHSSSQLINSVLEGRPLISTVYPLFEDILIILAGVAGILIGNTFKTTLKNALLLTAANSLLMGSSYILLCQLGIWLPVLPASTLLGVAGVTYIAFYQSERQTLMESKKLEEERRKTIEGTFNAIHAGPLQTLASLLRNVRDGKTDPKNLLDDLESLNNEIRGIGERLRLEAIEDVYFVDTRRNIKLDLTHPMHEVFYEIYNLCLQKDLPGFKTIRVRSVSFESFDCNPIDLEIKRKLCWFLQESLDNVGKHAFGTTRLLVTGKITEGFYTLRIEDNGPGLKSTRIGEGTKLFYRLEELLRGKFSRISKPAGGTICELIWSLHCK